jgi:hypothetical protein
LEKNKKAAINLVAAKDGRFGIVVFKGEAFTMLPLTTNKNSVVHIIETLSPDLFSATGTDVGKGLLRAVESFPSHENTDKRLFIFTDAEEPDKGSFPRLRNAITDTIIRNNISLYIIPPDKKTGSPVPDRDVISVPDMEMINTLARLPNSSVVSLSDLSRAIPLSLSHKGSHVEYSFSLLFSFMGFFIFIIALLLRGIKWQNIV